jgi:hypothetical protein
MRPDGAIVLTIDDSELIDVESAFMNGGDACKLLLETRKGLDVEAIDDLCDASQWLAKLGDCVGTAEGRPAGTPRLHSVK